MKELDKMKTNKKQIMRQNTKYKIQQKRETNKKEVTNKIKQIRDTKVHSGVWGNAYISARLTLRVTCE